MSSSKSQPPPPKTGLWQRIGPDAFREARFNPYRITAVALAIAVAIGAASYFGSRSSGDDATTTQPAASQTAPSGSASPSPSAAAALTPAEQYRADTFKDFGGISGVTLEYQQILIAWNKGVPTDAVLSGTFTLVRTRALEVRDLLAKRASFEGAPRALSDYRVAAQLYLESARVGQSALLVPKGPLRDQLRLQVNRLRELADRTFDQAKAELEALAPSTSGNDAVTEAQPIEVPDFPFLSLAPGSPLDTAPAVPAEPRRAIKDKAEQPFGTWASAVGTATPSARDVAGAISTGTAAQLQAVSRRLTAASSTLFTVPDPKGEHLVAVRVEMGRLIEAEGARAAQAATLTSGVTQSGLRLSAQRLALLGSQLWDERLGARSTGFPDSLLTDA